MVTDFLGFLGKFFWQLTGNYDFKSRIAILQKPEVTEVIGRYPFNKVKVKSLHLQDIEDPFFIHRLLPQYSEHEINSLVLIETPNEKLVFLDDKETESFIRLDYQLLKKNLDSLTVKDLEIFNKNLN